MVHPVSGVQVVTAGLGLDELGTVRVPEDDELEIRMASQKIGGERGQTVCAPRFARVRSPQPPRSGANPSDEWKGQVRRGQAEQRAEHAAPRGGPERSIGVLSLQQAVSVRHVGVPSGDLRAKRTVQELHADLLAEKAAGPAVVVSADEPRSHSGVHDIGEPAKNGEVAAKHDTPVLEPEIEQVTVDEQVLRPPGEPFEELEKRPLAVRRYLPDVHIGDDDGGWTVHARN